MARWLIVFLFLGSACSEDFDYRLTGQWQLRTVITREGSCRVDTIFYNFDRHVLWLHGKSGAAYGEFLQKGDSLYIQFVDSNQVCNLHRCNSLGWDETSRNFLIQQLDRSQLCLRDENMEMQFRRY